MKNCYVFDIDGTLADLTHRLQHIQKAPKDWDAFFDACSKDASIEHMIVLCRTMVHYNEIIFVSGRAERCRSATVEWLHARNMWLLSWLHGPPRLYMRKDGDHRPDYQVKLDMLEVIRTDGWNPVMVFDDRDQVVRMWREQGIPCSQVADGDF